MPMEYTTDSILIFTDLDGTLLDHHSYSFEEAMEMLQFIKLHHIPLIIVTSKTKNEVLALQKALDINEPFIVENGAGIYIPTEKGYKTIPMGQNHTQIRDAFKRYAKEIPMRGFSDMDNEEVAKLTELPLERAIDAKKRTYTEPFVLEDREKLTELKKMAEKDGLEIVEGGRFYHLITKGQDKAAAIDLLIHQYQEEFNKKFTTIALGDSANDLTMLQSVDTPILIPHSDGSYIPNSIDQLINAPFPGPSGWNAALKEYFNV